MKPFSRWLAVLSMLLSFSALAVPEGVSKQEGLPDLGLHDFSGKPVSLNDKVGKGKWTLVMFWGLNCPICERNKPAINEFHEKHKNTDAEVFGIAINGMAKKPSIEALLKRSPTTFPNYIAELGLMAMNFEIAAGEPFRGTPTYWLFNPKGELVAVNPGPVRLEALENYIATH